MTEKSRKEKLKEIDGLLEMVEPFGVPPPAKDPLYYAGGSVHYNFVKWLRDEVARLEKINKNLKKKLISHLTTQKH